MIEPSPDEKIRQLTREIAHDYGAIEVGEIEQATRDAYEELAARSKAPAFIGILTERRVREQLGVDQARRSA